MILEILIPQFSETEEVIKPLLDSIAMQQNVDFNEIGVIICNDGSKIRLSQDFLKGYDFSIKYVICEHKGVSATRNACINEATAEYVMFCDADDMFYNACGLWIIFEEIKKGQFDSLTSFFIEETKNPQTKLPMYINRENDVTFVHGKVHRRKFLLDNDIRWNEKLTIHEDSYFNVLCKTLAKEFRYVSSPFYLWKWRDDSVCRRDEKYMLKTYVNMLDSNTELVYELFKRGLIKEASYRVTAMIFETYFTMQKKEWREKENRKYRKDTEKRFRIYFRTFKPLYDKISDNEKTSIIASIRNRMYAEGVILEHITFEQWIKMLRC